MLHAEHGCKPCQYQENPPKQKGRLTSPAVHHQQIKHRRRRNQLYINKHIIKLPFQVEVHRPQHKGSQIQLEPGAYILINSHCRQIGNEDSSNPPYHPSAGRFLRLPVLQGIIGGHPRKEKKNGYRVKENILYRLILIQNPLYVINYHRQNCKELGTVDPSNLLFFSQTH